MPGKNDRPRGNGNFVPQQSTPAGDMPQRRAPSEIVSNQIELGLDKRTLDGIVANGLFPDHRRTVDLVRLNVAPHLSAEERYRLGEEISDAEIEQLVGQANWRRPTWGPSDLADAQSAFRVIGLQLKANRLRAWSRFVGVEVLKDFETRQSGSNPTRDAEIGNLPDGVLQRQLRVDWVSISKIPESGVLNSPELMAVLDSLVDACYGLDRVWIKEHLSRITEVDLKVLVGGKGDNWYYRREHLGKNDVMTAAYAAVRVLWLFYTSQSTNYFVNGLVKNGIEASRARSTDGQDPMAFVASGEVSFDPFAGMDAPVVEDDFGFTDLPVGADEPAVTDEPETTSSGTAAA